MDEAVIMLELSDQTFGWIATQTAPIQPLPAALIHSEMRCTTVLSIPR